MSMHRDLIREAEIAEEELLPPRGEMAVVADPDACGDEEDDLPETLPEPITLESPQSHQQPS